MTTDERARRLDVRIDLWIAEGEDIRIEQEAVKALQAQERRVEATERRREARAARKLEIIVQQEAAA